MSDLPHMHRRVDDAPNEAPAPMTHEQLNYFTRQTSRAVDKALSKYMARAAVGFILLFAGFLFNAWNNAQQWERIESDAEQARATLIESGDIIAVDGCNRDFRTTQTLRGVLEASAEFTRQSYSEGRLDKAELEQRLTFYNEQLAQLQPPDCRKAQGIITDDEDHPLEIPEPLYVGSEANKTAPAPGEGG
jgi:hypothetical protein